MNAKEQLKARQEQLRAEIVRREENIQHLSDTLEQNFGRIALNSIMPAAAREGSVLNRTLATISSVLGSVLPGETGGGKYDGLLKSAKVVVAGLAWKYLKKLIK